MSSLTPNTDKKISSPKRRARRNEVSALNKQKSGKDSTATPILESLRGILKTGDIEDYRAYLVDKYK
jgi:hypothetical protein